MTAVLLSAGGVKLAATLGDGPAARQLVQSLPVTIAMSRWGDEYYGALPVRLPAGEKRRDVYEVGEIARWPEGNAFCLFFGPTPASHGDEPRMASPGVPLGRIDAGAQALAGLGPRITLTIAAA